MQGQSAKPHIRPLCTQKLYDCGLKDRESIPAHQKTRRVANLTRPLAQQNRQLTAVDLGPYHRGGLPFRARCVKTAVNGRLVTELLFYNQLFVHHPPAPKQQAER